MIRTNQPRLGTQPEKTLEQSSTAYNSPSFVQDQVVEKPTTASSLSIGGGVLLIFGGLFETSNVGIIGGYIGSTTYTLTAQDRLTLGTFGIVFGAVMIASGYMLRSHPEEHVPWGAIVLILAIMSIFTSLGGLIVGLFLGLAGGSKAIRWRPQSMTLTLDSGVWKSYAGEVINDLNTIPGESDRIFAIYEKSGLDGVVSYLKQKDPDLTNAEAIPIATRILQEIDLRRRQSGEKQNTPMPIESTAQGRMDAGASKGETNTAQGERKEKSWIERWLKR